MLRSLALALILAMGLAACGGTETGQTNTSSTPAATLAPGVTPSPTPDAAADQALAKAILLTTNDIPTGWAEELSEEEEDSPFVKCEGEHMGDATRAETGAFSKDRFSEISQVVTIYQAPEHQRAAVRAYIDERAPCVVKVFNDGGADERDAHFRDASLARVSFPTYGDASELVRVAVTLETGGYTFQVYYDILVVSQGRLGFALIAIGVNSPFNGLEQWAEMAAAKLPAVPAESTTTTATSVPRATPTSSQTPAPVTSQPPTASPFLGGDDVPLSDGEPGELSVIAVGTTDGSTPIVLRNNTNKSLKRIHLKGIARDASGALLGSGEDQGFEPSVVRPGEIAIGYVYWGFGVEFSEGVKFEFNPSADEGERETYFLSLDIVELNKLGDRIVGIGRNGHQLSMSGPISVRALCFDAAGRITGSYGTFADADEVPPGGQAPFQIDLYGKSCEYVVVGASGYGEL